MGVEFYMDSCLRQQIIHHILPIMFEGASKVLSCYQKEHFTTRYKSDKSLVTSVDEEVHDFFLDKMNALLPIQYPIISEEMDVPLFDERSSWEYHWLLDPLDGTRGFVEKLGEFAICLALLAKGRPILGFIAIPTEEVVYYGDVIGGEAYWCKQGQQGDIIRKPIYSKRLDYHLNMQNCSLTLLVSRYHLSDAVKRFREELSELVTIREVSLGSAWKYCRLAEGKADIYLGGAGSYEWDVAAGQAIVRAAGGLLCNRQKKDIVFNQNKHMRLEEVFVMGCDSLLCLIPDV